jgi:hypothetical protein
MKKDFGFFKTKMPETRKADFYLGCLDGYFSVRCSAANSIHVNRYTSPWSVAHRTNCSHPHPGL